MKSTKIILISLAGLIAGGASFYAQHLLGANCPDSVFCTLQLAFHSYFAFLLSAFLSIEVPTIAMIFSGSVFVGRDY